MLGSTIAKRQSSNHHIQKDGCKEKPKHLRPLRLLLTWETALPGRCQVLLDPSKARVLFSFSYNIVTSSYKMLSNVVAL